MRETAPAPVRVLGIDPGSRVTGYGILDARAGLPPCLVTAGALRLRKATLPERLRELHEGLELIVREHRPAVVAVEAVFHGKSFDSVLKVGEVRGVVLLAAALAGLEVAEYAPAVVKKSATGNGRASKEQVQRMMARHLAVERVEGPLDVSDALAVAFCYAHALSRRPPPLRDQTPVRRLVDELRARSERGTGGRARALQDLLRSRRRPK